MDTRKWLEHVGRERELIYKTFVLTGRRLKELASITVGNLDLDAEVPYFVLDAADEKNRHGSELPLRDDLSRDIRTWLADKLKARQEEARQAGQPIPMVLPSNTPLFYVPTGLRRILDRDLVAAGLARMVTDDKTGKTRIDKRDERGRTIDVHALRHTFGTHLSKGGVPLRTAQAAMRHSDPALTANVYTDPKLLDVRGALNALPNLPLAGPPAAQAAKATGTDGTPSCQNPALPLAPVLAPPPGNLGARAATSGYMPGVNIPALGSGQSLETDDFGHEKGSQSTGDREPQSGPDWIRPPRPVPRENSILCRQAQ